MTADGMEIINTIMDVLIIKHDDDDENPEMQETRRQFEAFDINKNKKPNEPEIIFTETDLRDIIDSFKKIKRQESIK